MFAGLILDRLHNSACTRRPQCLCRLKSYGQHTQVSSHFSYLCAFACVCVCVRVTSAKQICCTRLLS